MSKFLSRMFNRRPKEQSHPRLEEAKARQEAINKRVAEYQEFLKQDMSISAFDGLPLNEQSQKQLLAHHAYRVQELADYRAGHTFWKGSFQDTRLLGMIKAVQEELATRGVIVESVS